MRLLLQVLLLLAAGTAFGDANSDAARRYFQSGSKHFDLGEYKLALDDFREGYRLKDDPVFLYNIAQCQRLLNQNVDALRSYKSYLRRKPDAANRPEVEHKIEALEQAVDSQEKAQRTPPNQILPTDNAHPEGQAAEVTATPPPPQRTPVYKKWWLWTGVGVVVVGVGLGVGLGLGLSSHHPVFPAVQF